MKIEDLIQKNHPKNETALSNDVFFKNDWYYKRYAINEFKKVFQIQDLKALKAIESTPFKLSYQKFDDGVATKRIPGIFINMSDIDKNKISLLIKKAYQLKLIDSSELEEPGFFRAIDFFDTLKYVRESIPGEKEVIEEVKKKAFEDVSFCHNDLIPDNTIFNESFSDLKFIDYEYSGNINFHFDLASIVNSWNLNDEQYLFALNEYERFQKVDYKYLYYVRLFLIIFWTKLCDYKFYETNNEYYMELRKNILTLKTKIREQYLLKTL